MPWKASSVMEERLRFVARLLDGEAMTAGISAGRDRDDHYNRDRRRGYDPTPRLASAQVVSPSAHDSAATWRHDD